MFANAQSYTITATAGANGSITPSGEITVDEGEDQAFTIEASTNYRIASVLVDDVEAKNDLVEGVYTFVNVTANHTIAATFEEIPAPTYTITLTVGEHGTVSYNDEVVATSVTVNENSTPAFTFNPESGYRVASVILDGETNVTNDLVGNVYTFAAITANHSLAVTFEEIPATTYTITLTVGEHGTVSYNDEVVATSVTVNESSTPAFTFNPETGYRVASVILDGETNVTNDLVGNVYTFAAVTANHTLAVTFEEIPAPTYTITLTVGEHGTVSYNDEVVATSVTVNESSTPAFTFNPETGYRVASVILDGETNVTNDLVGNVYTFAAITANHTLAVTFEEIPAVTYTIAFTIGEHGTVTYNDEAVTTSVTVNENATPSFTITPETGYRVASAIIDEGEDEEEDVTDAIEDDVYTFEAVTASHTMHITFEESTTPNTHTVTLTVGAHGTIVATDDEDNPVTIEDGVITVNHGDDLYLEITPDQGYKIEELVVNENPYDLDDDELLGLDLPMLNITSNMTVSVTFEEDNDTPEPTMLGITFEGLAEGDMIVVPVTVDSSYVHTAEVADSVVRGNDFVFGFELAECHQIDKVIVNEVELVADGDGYYTLENVVSDTTITIEYAEVNYNLTISAGEHGSVAVTEAEVECGESYTVNFLPDNGYKLQSVLLDGVSTTDGVSGNNYTLTVLSDHSIEGVFAEFRGPYVEYIGFEESHEVGDTIEFSLKMHANCLLENICAVRYALVKDADTVTDITSYGVFSYDVNVTDDSFVTNQILTGSGMLNYTADYDDVTYNVGAFTLGLFDEVAGRDRTVDYNMIFTTAGNYKFVTTLYTCTNGGETVGSGFVANECDDLTHYDRIAETCSNPRKVYEISGDLTITGSTIHTITATVLGGHGTVDPDGTIIVDAGTSYDVVFTPDENYALDTVKSNGFLIYPSLSTQYVVDNVFRIDSITENYNITVKYKDVRPYYTVHVEVTTAGGSVTPRDTSVVVGSDVTLIVTPNDGYHISQLDIDGNLVINYASNEIIFRDIHEDHNVTISFFPNSIEDEVFANMSIYPNPNNGQFTVSSEEFEGDVTFQIYSISGAMMETRTVNGEKTVSFDRNLPAGTYFLRVILGDKVATRKIVVE